MLSRETRSATPRELADAAQRALRTLDQGLAAVDSEDWLGFDTIAQRLRLLVGRGPGNSLLRRIADGTDTPLRPVVIAQPSSPPSQGPGRGPLTLAVVNLPVDQTMFFPFLLEHVQLFDLMRRPVLGVDRHFASIERSTAASQLRMMTWDELLALIANKLGPVHVDDDVPKVLDDIAGVAVMGLNPAAIALRALAITTGAVGRALLHDIGVHPTVEEPRTYLVGDHCLGRVRVWGRLGGLVDVDILGSSRAGSTNPVTVRWTTDDPPLWPWATSQ